MIKNILKELKETTKKIDKKLNEIMDKLLIDKEDLPVIDIDEEKRGV